MVKARRSRRRMQSAVVEEASAGSKGRSSVKSSTLSVRAKPAPAKGKRKVMLAV
jgi:hypothetical protein